MASLKGEPSGEDEFEQNLKRTRRGDASESKPDHRVALNPADCNLDFNVEGNGLRGSALHEKGFAYCWSGARANAGIIGGKYCFGCNVVSTQPVEMDDTPHDKQHLCRVGVSTGDKPVGSLGESSCSFGYGGTGKFSTENDFLDYGEKFGVGDTIICAVDLESKPLASIGFSKNGKWLGVAKQFDASGMGLGVDTAVSNVPWKSALFPHILLKNVEVEMHFSLEDGLVPEDGFKPWACAFEDQKAILGPAFSDISCCEIMMMVGLPASGKTTWAEKWIKEHPEKRYVLLGTNLVLDQMKVPGLRRKENYGERFDRLMDRATDVFNILLTRAARTARNYILDQTNVYKSARKRKLKPFASFRKIAVVVFPKPEELKSSSQKRFREMGKEVPADAVNQMLANYALPTSVNMRGSDEYFDQVMFAELDRLESQRHLDEMKQSLASHSNLNVKSNFSPYSLGTAVGSYPLPRKEHVSSVTGGHLMDSHVATPHPSYQVLNRFDSYQDHQEDNVAGAAAAPGSFQRSFYLASDYGYPSMSSAIANVGSDCYPICGMDNSYNRSDMVSNSVRGVSTDGSYQGNGVNPFLHGSERASSGPYFTSGAPSNVPGAAAAPGSFQRSFYPASDSGYPSMLSAITNVGSDCYPIRGMDKSYSRSDMTYNSMQGVSTDASNQGNGVEPFLHGGERVSSGPCFTSRAPFNVSGNPRVLTDSLIGSALMEDSPWPHGTHYAVPNPGTVYRNSSADMPPPTGHASPFQRHY
ncbi:heterogeneous nuclear ribonucleoprotein U-like protein 1 isoform X2 [Rhodamnia argentea]|uniref:Heterogeneous nuclear ribonucleoprotein U-like protein 1 isoform X2 n=1 Tax=Rhodamnia argentea TaxID=178133 RepID=A0A8B8N6L6_9MYRT|nr:heterogeneous nuclear ribonucleoprotein U-like protein 1 isoform X2 [Rhodamnia argentea]